MGLIRQLTKGLLFPLFGAENKIDDPAQDGDNGDEVPDELGLEGAEVFSDNVDQGQHGQNK